MRGGAGRSAQNPHGLVPAGTAAKFREAPLGRYLVGDGYCYWCGAQDLFGFVLFGRPGAAAVERLVAALKVELEPGVAPHRSLVDTSLVEAVDPGAFDALQKYVSAHHARLSQQVTRLALVRPPGLVGAVVAGFYQVLHSPYPTQAFDALEPALQWLGCGAEWAARLEALRAEVSGVPPLLSQVRSVLAALGPRAELAQVAKQLALSERTLQRRLTALGTTFAQEQFRQRLAVAQRLMRESEAPLTEVAISSGFSSLQHFSSAFRKATGKSPSDWRRAGDVRAREARAAAPPRRGAPRPRSGR